MPPTPRILVLDNAIYPEAYQPFDHWQAAFSDAAELVRVTLADPRPSLDGFTHMVVSGSEASILDDDPWVPPQMALIAEAASRRLPVLGSCHGHQMIARALGGEVGRAAEPELGWIPVEVDRSAAMFAGMNTPAWIFVSHFDEVVSLPREFQVTARSPRCAIHAFSHSERPVWGVQSHPEIGIAEGEELLGRFAALDPRVATAAIHRPAKDTGLLRHLVAQFLNAGGEL